MHRISDMELDNVVPIHNEFVLSNMKFCGLRESHLRFFILRSCIREPRSICTNVQIFHIKQEVGRIKFSIICFYLLARFCCS